MKLYKVTNPEVFSEVSEAAMDVHYATKTRGGVRACMVVGERVAIVVDEEEDSPIRQYLNQRWLTQGLAFEERLEAFERRMGDLPTASFEPRNFFDLYPVSESVTRMGIDRDRGMPRGTSPPTPPGIRIRTAAVRSS